MHGRIEPVVAWARSGTAQLGFGWAAEVTARDSREALQLAGALARGDHGPGPWFGGIAFPGSQTWSGFPAARFVRPERVGAVELARLPLCAGAPVSEATPLG